MFRPNAVSSFYKWHNIETKCVLRVKTAWTYLEGNLTYKELRMPWKWKQQILSTHLLSYTVSLLEYRNLHFYRRKNLGRFRDKYAAQHSFLKNTNTPSLQKGGGKRISQPRKQIKLQLFRFSSCTECRRKEMRRQLPWMCSIPSLRWFQTVAVSHG